VRPLRDGHGPEGVRRRHQPFDRRLDPARRAIRSAARDVDLPEAIGALIDRCLEKHPDRRPESAVALAAAFADLTGWVRREALPRLSAIVENCSRLEEGSDGWDAFLLATEIEKLAPGDPILERLWPDFTFPIGHRE
jgi:hypothetical protein